MKYVYLALNWVFGVLFLLAGLLSLVESPLGGLCLIIISFLLLPPLRKFVYSKTNKELPVKARAVTIFALFVAFGVFVGQAQDKKEQELAAQQADRKSTRLNSSHVAISYAVFCLKKKKTKKTSTNQQH